MDHHIRARLPLLLTPYGSDLIMPDWCTSDFLLMALAAAGVIAVGVLTISKIVRW
jgi:hypothetical protein